MKSVLCIGLIWGLMLVHLHGFYTLEVDPMQSRIGFTATKFGFFDVNAVFHSYSAVVVVKQSGDIDRIEVRIDTNSIDSGHSIRDRMLRGKDFLGAHHHDFIGFVAEGPIPITSTSITGYLTVKGISKKVTVPVELNYLKSNAQSQLVLAAIIPDFELQRDIFGVSGFPFLISPSVSIKGQFLCKVYSVH